MIRSLGYALDVSEAVKQLENPEVWNERDERRKAYAHAATSDCWVRFRDMQAWDGSDGLTDEHESVWQPVVHKIPAVWSLVRKVLRRERPERLGGVLLTKIPPGGSVEPHIDSGWHAGYYEKIAVQIRGNKEQAFCFENCELRPVAGEVYTFRNDVLHWVTNDSAEDRITLIVCLRRA